MRTSRIRCSEGRKANLKKCCFFYLMKKLLSRGFIIWHYHFPEAQSTYFTALKRCNRKSHLKISFFLWFPSTYILRFALWPSEQRTRDSSKKLNQSWRRINYGKYCISYWTPSIWSSMPVVIKDCKHLNTFRYKS